MPRPAFSCATLPATTSTRCRSRSPARTTSSSGGSESTPRRIASTTSGSWGTRCAKEPRSTRSRSRKSYSVSERTRRKVRLSLEYDGTLFHGWQHQPGERTVEGMLEEALSSVERRCVARQGASRTDQGVHALGQSAHFLSEAPIPTERYPAALNGRLPPDVRVTGAEDVADDFDARRSAVGKLYRYWIDGRRAPSVFLAR